MSKGMRTDQGRRPRKAMWTHLISNVLDRMLKLSYCSRFCLDRPGSKAKKR